MALKKLFGKLAGKVDDIADVARYADDVVDPLIADNAGRALMSPELLSDDFLDAVDDFAYHTPVPDTTSHILGSNPRAIINKQPGYNMEHEHIFKDFNNPGRSVGDFSHFRPNLPYTEIDIEPIDDVPIHTISQTIPRSTRPIHSGTPRTLDDFYDDMMYHQFGRQYPEERPSLPTTFKELVERQRGLSYPKYKYWRLGTDDDLPF